jgi:hypothetical protein
MMVSRQDWEAAYDQVIAGGRNHVDPPTPEEMVAYANGELSESEAARIAEALGYYPVLADALANDEELYDDEALSDAELAEDWRSLRGRMEATPVRMIPRPSRFWQWATAASLALLAISSSLYFRATSTIDTLEARLSEPRQHIERIVLFENRTRGSSAAPQAIDLLQSTEYVVLTLTSVEEVRGERFHVDIRDVKTSQPVWTGGITPGRDGTFVIEVPRRLLRSDQYAVALYADGATQPKASYGFVLTQ